MPPSPVGRGGLGGGGGIQKDNQVKPKTPTRRPASGRQASSADSKGAEATSPPRAPPVTLALTLTLTLALALTLTLTLTLTITITITLTLTLTLTLTR